MDAVARGPEADRRPPVRALRAVEEVDEAVLDDRRRVEDEARLPDGGSSGAGSGWRGRARTARAGSRRAGSSRSPRRARPRAADVVAAPASAAAAAAPPPSLKRSLRVVAVIVPPTDRPHRWSAEGARPGDVGRVRLPYPVPAAQTGGSCERGPPRAVAGHGARLTPRRPAAAPRRRAGARPAAAPRRRARPAPAKAPPPKVDLRRGAGRRLGRALSRARPRLRQGAQGAGERGTVAVGAGAARPPALPRRAAPAASWLGGLLGVGHRSRPGRDRYSEA